MRNVNGYTLLEMIVAIAIFLMVMLVVGTGSIAVQNTWGKLQDHSYKLKKLQTIERVVSPSFRNAVPFNWKDDNRKSKSIFVGESDSISFAYLHRINNVSEGGIRFLKLFLDGGMLVAEYNDRPIVPWLDNNNVKTEILSGDVRSLEFLYAYMDNDRLEWGNAWEEDGVKIPLAIQMTIEWDDGEKESWLRRTSGNSFKEKLDVKK